MQFDDFSILVIAHEDEDGSRIVEEEVRVFRDGSRPAETLGRAERIPVTQLVPLHLAVGSGYGLDPDWRHGMYQGPDLVVQQVGMPAEEAAARSDMFGITERLSRFEYDGPKASAPASACSRRCSSARTGRAGSRTGWRWHRSRCCYMDGTF